MNNETMFCIVHKCNYSGNTYRTIYHADRYTFEPYPPCDEDMIVFYRGDKMTGGGTLKTEILTIEETIF